MHHTKGVEITTGPLGSGLASAVGMAMAQRRQRGLLDPDAKPGESVFDHHVWVLASDGDLMEGVTSEASSLAGHQELGNLIVVYDANQISIEDDTDISFSEDVAKRYEAYGWEVVDIDWRKSTDPAGTADYIEDVDALLAALEKSRKSRSKPTLVRLHTIIAWPAPTARSTGKSHGSALGADEIAATKQLLGFDPAKSFEVDRDVLAHTRAVKKRGKAAHRRGTSGMRRVAPANPERAALLDRLVDARAPRRLREGAAGVRGRPRTSRRGRHPARCSNALGRRAARAVGRLGRPRRVEQHHDGRRRLLHPQGQADPRVEGRALRPHPALRHPRARHGRDPQRHRAARA